MIAYLVSAQDGVIPSRERRRGTSQSEIALLKRWWMADQE